ncbi:MAG TPA: cell division protein FtsA [Candidatus Paceibacterota bacterium]
MRRSVGVDIGTSEVKVVVAEESERGLLPRIVAVGHAESRGLRHGYVVQPAEAVKSVRRAIRQAEKASGARITRAYLGVSGVGLSSATAVGGAMVSRADNEISELDLAHAQEEAHRLVPPASSANRRVIHAVPLESRIDGRKVLGNPLGMRGARLETRQLFVTCVEQHYEAFVEALEESQAEAADLAAGPIAAAFVGLTRPQKVAGAALVDIGAETTSIVVFEEEAPVSLEVFPIGGAAVTNDIALGLRISLEEAEAAKRVPTSLSPGQRARLDEAADARAIDILDLVEAHLRRIGRAGLLPAGVTLVGGGSAWPGLAELARDHLRLPSRAPGVAAAPTVVPAAEGQGPKLPDGAWSVAYGLAVWGFSAEDGGSVRLGYAGKAARQMSERLRRWVRQFMP